MVLPIEAGPTGHQPLRGLFPSAVQTHGFAGVPKISQNFLGSVARTGGIAFLYTIHYTPQVDKRGEATLET